MPEASIIGTHQWNLAYSRSLTAMGWQTAEVDIEAEAVAVPATAELCFLGGTSQQRDRWFRPLFRRRRCVILVGGVSAMDSSSAASLARAAAKRRIVLGVLGGWRFIPLAARLREWTSSGVLGQVTRISLSIHAAHPDLRKVFAALDLGLWLTDLSPPAQAAVQGSDASALNWSVGSVDLTVQCESQSAAVPPWFSIALETHLGSACGRALIPEATPGTVLADQRLTIETRGRKRQFELPPADPALLEVVAASRMLRDSEPALCVCDMQRAAALLDALPDSSAVG